jgi:DNA polymerase III epsilon subunit-like protein
VTARLRARWGSGTAGPDPATTLAELDFVAIDTETTGLDPRRDLLVAVAAVPFVRGQPRLESGYTRLVNPGSPIPASAQAIHGIGDADVRDAPSAAAALPGLLDACRGRVLVAHTVAFDLALINRSARGARLPRLQAPALDIGALAHGVFPSWWDLSLEGLGRLMELEPVGRHTAEGDALTAGLLFLRLVPWLERRGITTLGAALRLQRRTALIPGGPGATGGGLAGP